MSEELRNDKFERWYCETYWDFKDYESMFQATIEFKDNKYSHLDIQLAWAAYQAATAAKQAEIEKLHNKIETMKQREHTWTQNHGEVVLHRMAIQDKDRIIAEQQKELSKHQSSVFHPDWSMLQASRNSNKELVQEVERLKHAINTALAIIDDQKKELDSANEQKPIAYCFGVEQGDYYGLSFIGNGGKSPLYAKPFSTKEVDELINQVRHLQTENECLSSSCKAVTENCDELRKQVALLREALIAISDPDSNHPAFSGYHPESMERIYENIAHDVLSKNPSTWFDEQIAAAKAEQREKDADICEDHEDYSIRFCAQLIRNQKD